MARPDAAGSLEQHLLGQFELPDDYFWHEVRWRAVRGFLPDHPCTLVDVGAGAGAIGRRLRAERPDVTYQFVEPIPSLAAQLRAQYGDDADVATRSTADAEIVVVLDVVEHQIDDREFVAALVRGARPGTLFVFTAPASMHLWSAWDVELGHYRRYTRRSIDALLTDAGLRVDEVSYLFPELWPVAAVRRVRAPARSADTSTVSTEFRPLPRSVNAMLTRAGRLSTTLRRVAPFGTSVFAVARRPDETSDDG
jgi:hypothetical protein